MAQNSRANSIFQTPHQVQSPSHLMFYSTYPDTGVEEMDTGDSRTRRLTCEQWKHKYDEVLNNYVEGIYNDLLNYQKQNLIT